MMLTVGATAAFATTPATTYQDQSEVKIYKHYGLEGNGTSPEETFYLVQADKEVLTGDISAEDVPNLIELTTKPDGANGYYVASVKFDEGGAKASETENVGAFVVKLPTYDQVSLSTPCRKLLATLPVLPIVWTPLNWLSVLSMMAQFVSLAFTLRTRAARRAALSVTTSTLPIL